MQMRACRSWAVERRLSIVGRRQAAGGSIVGRWRGTPAARVISRAGRGHTTYLGWGGGRDRTEVQARARRELRPSAERRAAAARAAQCRADLGTDISRRWSGGRACACACARPRPAASKHASMQAGRQAARQPQRQAPRQCRRQGHEPGARGQISACARCDNRGGGVCAAAPDTSAVHCPQRARVRSRAHRDTRDQASGTRRHAAAPSRTRPHTPTRGGTRLRPQPPHERRPPAAPAHARPRPPTLEHPPSTALPVHLPAWPRRGRFPGIFSSLSHHLALASYRPLLSSPAARPRPCVTRAPPRVCLRTHPPPRGRAC